jgi:hypothetical protein
MSSLVELARYLWTLIEHDSLEQMVRELNRHDFVDFVRHYFPWIGDEFSEVLEDLYRMIRRWAGV